jgi:uncharacterized protein YndB with AHSA1/START domain
MMTSRSLVSLRVAARPERAFWVFVGDIGAWWRPNGLFRFTTRSGRARFRARAFIERFGDDEVFEIGRITAWEPGARLAFAWRQASFAPNQITQVEVPFKPIGDETRVTVQHISWDTIRQDYVARHRFPDAVFLRPRAEWWQLLLAAGAIDDAV